MLYYLPLLFFLTFWNIVFSSWYPYLCKTKLCFISKSPILLCVYGGCTLNSVSKWVIYFSLWCLYVYYDSSSSTLFSSDNPRFPGNFVLWDLFQTKQYCLYALSHVVFYWHAYIAKQTYEVGIVSFTNRIMICFSVHFLYQYDGFLIYLWIVERFPQEHCNQQFLSTIWVVIIIEWK